MMQHHIDLDIVSYFFYWLVRIPVVIILTNSQLPARHPPIEATYEAPVAIIVTTCDQNIEAGASEFQSRNFSDHCDHIDSSLKAEAEQCNH